MHYEVWNELTPRELPIINNLGPRFNFDLPLILKECSTNLKNEKGKLHISEKRITTLRRDTAAFFEKFKRNERFPDLTVFLSESYYLGFSYSHTLKGIYSKHINNLLSLKELRAAPDRRDNYISVVQIAEVEKRVSRNKKEYVKYTLKDDSDSLTVMDFQLDNRGGKKFSEDMIAVFHITKKKTETGDFLYFVSDIVEQEVPTVLKTSVVRKELEDKQNKENN
jgi:DNA polymerase III alpha subunit